MSLIIKISLNGSSQEYLFNKPGPIIIGSDERCDLYLEDLQIDPKLLEVKISGGNIFIKEIGGRARMYLNSVILPFREETRYREGDSITLKDTNYQISILKVAGADSLEPPPFFESDFKERLERMDLKIKEKETELKKLDHKEEKKKVQLLEIEDKYHRQAHEKGRLEVEVGHLKSQKEVVTHELRQNKARNQDTEDKILQLKDFVQRLENDEKNLKETIVSQTLVLANLKDEREKKSRDVEQQRILLAGLELDTLKAGEELKNLKEEFESQEQEIILETGKVQKILSSSQEAMKEGAKIQHHIAGALKEKTMLDHEVKDLQELITKLEVQRSEAQDKLLGLKNQLEHEEHQSRKIQEDIKRQSEEESNLKIINNELRAELMKVEEKLSFKKNQINQFDFQNQDMTSKLTTINFELERSTLRLKDLQSEEKAQELKVLALREEFHELAKKARDDKKNIHKAADEERSKLQLELGNLSQEIESEKKNLFQIESQKKVMEIQLSEVEMKQRLYQKEKSSLEAEVAQLRSSKSLIESQIQGLKSESVNLHHEKDLALRELGSLKLKLQDCESKIKESLEEAQVQVESYKREERSRIQAEKEVYLAEVEAFKQKSMIEIESEYRRKEEDIHQKKIQMLQESEDIVREARQTEVQITQEADKRLRTATLEAQERETLAHNRIKEAQEYFKEKEKEADVLIQRSRLESRELIKKTELELLEDLAKRKTRIKKFLTMRQEKGLSHLKAMTDQHMAKMRRSEEKAHEKLEDIKRKELKKVAKIREEELSHHHEMKEVVMKELKVHKEKALKEIHAMKVRQEGELAEKKKSVLDHINQTKFRSQETWQEEQRREKELFERTKKLRIQNATQAVMNVLIAEAGSMDREPIIRDKILSTLEMAIDGQDADALNEMDQVLDFNPENRKKVLPVLQKYALRFGVPAVVATILLLDIGSLRTNIVESTKELIKSQQSASEIYVNQQKSEWKEKYTFTPETTIGYKGTYVDNVLYTTDFQKMMDNEEFQNDWILKVHDFMVKELELSEDLAISFISSEGTLLKDLAAARKELNPQFLDTGMKKLTDLEKTHLGWLNEKIPDSAKLEKFTKFRKDYYDKFYQEKVGGSRSMASEAQPSI